MAGASLSHIRPRDDPIMASSARVSTEAVDPADRLRHARRTVIAGLADPAVAAPRPVTSSTPIRTLPTAVAAVVAARTEAGLSPVGTFFPRRPPLRRFGVPALGLSGSALAVGVAALLVGWGWTAFAALVGFAVLAIAGGVVVRWARADPLRIGSQARFVVEAASRWTPGRVPVEPGQARALVATAAAAAQRIVDSSAWRTGVLTRGGVVVPLATELDLTEQRAARSRDEDWARLVTRVAALVAYADTVALPVDATDELAAADIEVLAFLLSTAIYNVN